MFVSWKDWVASPSSIISGFSGATSLNSSDKAKDRRLAVKWQNTFPAAAFSGCQIDLPSAAPVGIVALLGHDFPQNTEVRATLSLGGITVGETAYAELWNPPSESGIARSYYLVFGSNFTCDKVSILVIINEDDPPTVGIGRIWAGPKWVPQLGAMFQGLGAGVVDPSRVVESQGGQVYTVDRARRRTLRMALTLPESEAIGTAADPDNNAQSLLFEAGNSGSVIVVPTTEGATAAERAHIIHRLGVYGILQRTSDLELLDRANANGNGAARLYRLSLDVLEQL